MKKLLLISSFAAISAAFGAPCKEVVEDPCTPSEPEPSSTTSCSECSVWTPPAMVIPEHSLNVTHSMAHTCHNVDIEHSTWTPPAISSLFCNCSLPETPEPEEEKKCVVEPEPEGLCPRTTSSYSVATDGAYGSPIAAFTSAQLVNGICRTADGQILGALELKIGKLNQKTRTVKVSGKITGINGKKLNARAVTAVVDSDNSFSCTLAFGGIVGNLPINVASAEAVPLASVTSSTGCTLQSCLLGGELRNGEVDFLFTGAPALNLPQGFGFVLDETSWSVGGTIAKGTTLKFAKAKSPKIVKTDTGFAIDGLDADNVRGLKLRYSKKTGVLKGDYTIYASDFQTAAGKPKLKKFKVKFGGFVYNGLGYGVATSSDAEVGAFTLQ